MCMPSVPNPFQQPTAWLQFLVSGGGLDHQRSFCRQAATFGLTDKAEHGSIMGFSSPAIYGLPLHFLLSMLVEERLSMQ